MILKAVLCPFVLRAFLRVSWLACAALVLFAAATQESDRGRALYDSYGCYQCHGHAGQGGGAARIAPTVYPFEAFVQFVRRPSNEMPAYPADALSDTDLEAIYRYVQAMSEPPALAELDILR
jgi:mono/diheme cytochrome c family protein